MRSAAIIIVEGNPFFTLGAAAATASLPFTSRNFALLDLLGETVLNRVISRLERYGIQPISVLSETDPTREFSLDVDPPAWRSRSWDGCGDIWSAVERALFQYGAQGVRAAVLMRVGGYAEIDFFDLLRFHREKHESITLVETRQGALPVTVLDLAQRTEWAERLHYSWEGHLVAGDRYPFSGYYNRLENAHDWRRQVQDALLGGCELRPVGRAVRPGLWLAESAQVDSRARILAPAYIGAHSRIRPGVLITRGSSIERSCEIDCGTVVEDSHLLPFSYLGPGLEVSHALIDGHRLLHLARNLELEIQDHKLLGRSQIGLRYRLPFKRPKQRVEGLLTPTVCPEPASLYSAGETAPSS